VIAGAGETGAEAARVFLENSWLGFDVRCFFDDDPAKADTTVAGKKIAGQLNEIVSYVKNNRIDMVYIALPITSDLKTRNIIVDLCETAAEVYLIPDIFNITLLRMSLSEIAGLPVVNLNDTPCNGLNDILKRLEDKVVALIILIIIFPLMLLIALCIKLTSPGPVIFRQRRYGINGEDMVILKFRTMTVCEDGPDRPQAVK
jgi:putative colanic acid biosynthesis UDP-glucose lipid carrier transferase